MRPNEDISVFGEIGRLATDGGRVQCHVCGKWFHALNQHVMKKHRMSCESYREQFGLNRRTPLASPDFSEKQRSGQTGRLSLYWAKGQKPHLQKATRPRSFRPEGLMKIREHRSSPEFRQIMRDKMLSGDHPATQPEARAKNKAAHQTNKHREDARRRVFDGTSPLLMPDVQEKARVGRERRKSKMPATANSDNQGEAK